MALTFATAVVNGDDKEFQLWLAGLDEAGLKRAQRSSSDWICRCNNPAKYPAFKPAAVQAKKTQVAARKGLIDARLAELVPREAGRIGMTADEIANITNANEAFAVKNAFTSTFSKRKCALESAQYVLVNALSAGKATAEDIALLEREVATRQALLDQVAPGKAAAEAQYKRLRTKKEVLALKAALDELPEKASYKRLKAKIIEVQEMIALQLE